MTLQNQAPPAVPITADRRHLISTIKRIGEHNFELLLAGDSESNKLRQVLVAQGRIIVRQLQGDTDPIPQRELDRIAVFDLMALLLLSNAMDESLTFERSDSQEAEDNRQARAALRSALATFNRVLGQNRFSPLRSEEPLAVQIWRTFSNITAAEAEQDAAAIKSVFRK